MKIVMHADMNSYFASVEQQANPFLRGRPVAICSRISPNACIIACSIEAKKLGIKTGFSLSEARALVPDIVALEVDPPKVRTTTERIFAVFADFTSAIEAYSIDEAFLDLTGHVQNFEAARKIAVLIKKRIREEVGEWLSCSIGIASTRWLAKFAGELQKPDGLTILKKEDLPKVYAGLPLQKAWGIAEGWDRRLNSAGIRTLGELLAANPLDLKRRFGVCGYALWANIAGVDLEEVKSGPSLAPKSIGHSYVFHKRTAEEKEISAIMMKLCEKAGRRLRRLSLEGGRVSVGWGLPASYRQRSSCLGEQIFDSYDIFRAARKIFISAWRGEIVTSLAITVSDLTSSGGQISIFSDRRKRQSVALALDAVNDRYGEFTVIRGQMWAGSRECRKRTAEAAPDRIGFRQTVPVF